MHGKLLPTRAPCGGVIPGAERMLDELQTSWDWANGLGVYLDLYLGIQNLPPGSQNAQRDRFIAKSDFNGANW